METQATTTTAAIVAKSPREEPGPDNPTRIQPSKPVSFTNGVLKLRHPHPYAPPPTGGAYKECLKNHAAAMGGHAVDGCGEFMPSPTSTPSDPTSFRCAACGCHRNFHRRDPDSPHAPPPPPPTQLIEYQPHHRHHPPPPPPPRSPNSPSPPPISSTYYPSAPHMLLALSNPSPNPNLNSSPNSRKRFRTKFTQNQKDKMHELAERLGWKMQKRDDDLINDFCNGIGVEKGVFKVWMHNNKNTLGKKDEVTPNNNGSNGLGINLDNPPHLSEYRTHHNNHRNDEVSAHLGNTNGSSSSSRD